MPPFVNFFDDLNKVPQMAYQMANAQSAMQEIQRQKQVEEAMQQISQMGMPQEINTDALSKIRDVYWQTGDISGALNVQGKIEVLKENERNKAIEFAKMIAPYNPQVAAQVLQGAGIGKDYGVDLTQIDMTPPPEYKLSGGMQFKQATPNSPFEMVGDYRKGEKPEKPTKPLYKNVVLNDQVIATRNVNSPEIQAGFDNGTVRYPNFMQDYDLPWAKPTVNTPVVQEEEQRTKETVKSKTELSPAERAYIEKRKEELRKQKQGR